MLACPRDGDYKNDFSLPTFDRNINTVIMNYLGGWEVAEKVIDLYLQKWGLRGWRRQYGLSEFMDVFRHRRYLCLGTGTGETLVPLVGDSVTRMERAQPILS